MEKKINTSKKRTFIVKECQQCQKSCPEESFFKSASPFFPDGHIDICTDCLERIIDLRSLNAIDALCRYAGWAFLPDEYTRLYERHKENALKYYGKIYDSIEYKALDWSEINDKWKRKMAENTIEGEIESLKGEKLEEYKRKWVGNYTYEEYEWLEAYYNDMCESFDIKTASHRDYLRKVCKISLEIDKELSAHGDIKKLSDTYDKLMNSANFTESSNKNKGDITSISELADYMEQKGFQPRFYDGEIRDEVDKTIANIKNFTRTLVLGEPSISEMAETALKAAHLSETMNEDDEWERVALGKDKKEPAVYNDEITNEEIFELEEDDEEILENDGVYFDIKAGNDDE